MGKIVHLYFRYPTGPWDGKRGRRWLVLHSYFGFQANAEGRGMNLMLVVLEIRRIYDSSFLS